MKLIKALGGRKAVALWVSLLVVLALLLLNRWIMPQADVPLDRATMLVDKSLRFLMWALGIFVGGNALQHVSEGVAKAAAIFAPAKPAPPTVVNNAPEKKEAAE